MTFSSKVCEEYIEEMFTFADKDCDGKISYKEFQTMINPPKPPPEHHKNHPVPTVNKSVTIKTEENSNNKTKEQSEMKSQIHEDMNTKNHSGVKTIDNKDIKTAEHEITKTVDNKTEYDTNIVKTETVDDNPVSDEGEKTVPQ